MGTMARWRATLGAAARTACVALALGLAPGASAEPAAAPPLPELPKLAPVVRPEADAAAVKDLEDLLGRLTAADARTRETARAALHDFAPSALGAVIQHTDVIRKRLDREKAPLVLEAARKEGKRALKAAGKLDDPAPKKKRKKKAPDGASPEPAKEPARAEDEGDWLDFLLQTPKPESPTWRDLVELTAMIHVLADLGTTPAYREMIAYLSHFNELFRIHVGRQIRKAGAAAVPALIEGRKHDARVVQRWSDKWLDELKRAIPAEAIDTPDPAILADVLRAYGRTRDVDALRVILSFVGADRASVRDAAREAVAAIGEPGLWQLRDAYQNQSAQKPPKDWGWDRLAREIFALHDRSRLAEIDKLLGEGLAAARAGRHADAVASFDKVLARVPLAPRRAEMAPSYGEVARVLAASEQWPAALELARKALRLDPKGAGARALQADVAWLEAMVSRKDGVPDRFLLERALELEPAHAGAKQALAALDEKAPVVEPPVRRQRRFLAAGGVGAGALALMAGIWWLGRRRRPSRAAAPAEASPEPAPAPVDPVEGPPAPPTEAAPGRDEAPRAEGREGPP